MGDFKVGDVVKIRDELYDDKNIKSLVPKGTVGKVVEDNGDIVTVNFRSDTVSKEIDCRYSIKKDMIEKTIPQAVIDPKYAENLIKNISDKIRFTVEAGEELHAEVDHKGIFYDVGVTIKISLSIPNYMVTLK